VPPTKTFREFVNNDGFVKSQKYTIFLDSRLRGNDDKGSNIK